MSKYKDWFDEHVIIDFGDFNNKEDKKKADDLKDKLKVLTTEEMKKLEEEFKDDNQRFSKAVIGHRGPGQKDCVSFYGE